MKRLRADGGAAVMESASTADLVGDLVRAVVDGDHASRRGLSRQIEASGWAVTLDERRLRRQVRESADLDELDLTREEAIAAILRPICEAIGQADRAMSRGRHAEALEACWRASRYGVSAVPPPWAGPRSDLATWIREGSSPDGG